MNDSIKIQSYNDQVLVDEYKKSGDISILGELYHRYTRFVFCVAIKYMKNEEESQEIVMQVFEKLVENLKRFEIDNFKPWLHSVVKNHCLIVLRNRGSHMRKQQEYEKDFPILVESDDQMYLDVDEDPELKLKYLEECLKELKKEQKECVDLFYLKQMCYQDVAEKTGHDMKKVKSYIQNGKRNLKICIETKYARQA